MQAEKERTNRRIGFILIIVAASLSSLGQLIWKLGVDSSDSTRWFYYLLGFLAAAGGMFVMTLAFGYGQVSILQLMMSLGFALSIFLGAFFLNEPITIIKLIGIGCIIAGSVVLGRDGNEASQ